MTIARGLARLFTRGGASRELCDADLKARVRRDHPLRAVIAGQRGARRSGAGARGALFADRPTVDPARKSLAGDAVPGVLFDPLGAAADGAARLRSAVPLVRRPRCLEGGVGPLDVLQQPRPAAGGRHRGEVSRRCAAAAEGEDAAVERALLGRRYADRGLGVDKQLQAPGRGGRAAGQAAGATSRPISMGRNGRTRRTPR